MKFEFRKPNGKALGTQGYEVNHERASSLIYTGLFCDKKVVALLVAKGDYDEIAQELDQNGSFIVRACNSYEELVKLLKEAREYVDCAYYCAFPDEQKNARILHDIDVMLLAAGETKS